jgi:hypothetical protein
MLLPIRGKAAAKAEAKKADKPAAAKARKREICGGALTFC